MSCGRKKKPKSKIKKKEKNNFSFFALCSRFTCLHVNGARWCLSSNPRRCGCEARKVRKIRNKFQSRYEKWIVGNGVLEWPHSGLLISLKVNCVSWTFDNRSRIDWVFLGKLCHNIERKSASNISKSKNNRLIVSVRAAAFRLPSKNFFFLSFFLQFKANFFYGEATRAR